MTFYAAFQTRRFAIVHARACLNELSRYLRAGVVVEELLADVEIAIAAYEIEGSELGGGRS